jgi:hypothetical protein
MRSCLAILLLIGSGLVFQGCGNTPTAAAQSPIHDHLRAIAGAYADCTITQGKPPQNLEELWPYLALRGDAQELLRSPRDGKALVIHWSVPMRGKDESAPAQVLVHESEGADGTRWTAFSDGTVQALRARDFRQALRGAAR